MSLSINQVVRWLKQPDGKTFLFHRNGKSEGVLISLGTQRNRHGFLLSGFVRFLEEGVFLYCLDAGNCFDPYPLASAARARGLPPETFLDRVFVSRAATCHQIVSVVEEMLIPLGKEPENKIVAVLGIDTLFTDEDLPLFERRHLFKRILKGIGEIRSAGIGCLLTHLPPSRDGENRQWHDLLHRTLRPSPVSVFVRPPLGSGKPRQSCNRTDGIPTGNQL